MADTGNFHQNDNTIFFMNPPYSFSSSFASSLCLLLPTNLSSTVLHSLFRSALASSNLCFRSRCFPLSFELYVSVSPGLFRPLFYDVENRASISLLPLCDSFILSLFSLPRRRFGRCSRRENRGEEPPPFSFFFLFFSLPLTPTTSVTQSNSFFLSLSLKLSLILAHSLYLTLTVISQILLSLILK